MREEAERTHAVVERDEHHVLGSPVLAVELGLGAPALAQAAAEDPHGHGQFLVGLSGRLRPYVQIEAVLAVGRLIAIAPLGGVAAGIVHGLIRRMAELVADAHAFPGDDGLRGAPAVLADGRCRVRDAAEDGHAGSVGQLDALDLSALDGQHGIFRGCRARGERQRAEKNEESLHIIGFSDCKLISLSRKRKCVAATWSKIARN